MGPGHVDACLIYSRLTPARAGVCDYLRLLMPLQHEEAELLTSCKQFRFAELAEWVIVSSLLGNLSET